MIRATHDITLPDDEIGLDFTRSSGPGGQHVNRTETAVQLRFNVTASAALPAPVKHRLLRLAGKSVSQDGTLIIRAERHRSRQRNIEDAMDRLAELVRRAAVVPKRRRPTRPTAGSRERRLAGKKRRSDVKKRRSRPTTD